MNRDHNPWRGSERAATLNTRTPPPRRTHKGRPRRRLGSAVAVVCLTAAACLDVAEAESSSTDAASGGTHGGVDSGSWADAGGVDATAGASGTDAGNGGGTSGAGTGGGTGGTGGDKCGTPGKIKASIDGVQIFDYGVAKSLVCLGLAYSTEQYNSGPPGAKVTVTKQDVGALEADLSGFADDHGTYLEKWGFVTLKGKCTSVLLEKWNWNPCSPYTTQQLKLETWVDQNGDCKYQGAENKEPYGGQMSWDPNKTYKLRIEWQ